MPGSHESSGKRRAADPERIAHFTIKGRLGEGGMGIVYRAEDETLRRTVALKVLRFSWEVGAEQRQRLLREARAGAALSHPNATTVYEVGEHDGQAFIAMEYLEGKTLRAFVGVPEIDVETKLRWLGDVARALAAAHRAGIVHRDVKPENVIITHDGIAKVVDFGVARAAASVVDARAEAERDGQPSTLATLTAEGVTIGTPLYMAPEQMLGQPIDGRTDQFAWGLLAYELLTGRSPWHSAMDLAPSVRIVAEIVSERPVPPLTSSGAPASVRAVVARTLEKNPAKRFASMKDVLDALGLETGAGRTTASLGEARAASRRWRRGGWVAGAAALGALIVSVIVVLVRSRHAAPGAGAVGAPGLVADAPVGFADVPMSATTSEVAKGKFKEAMAKMAGGELPEEDLDAAMAADPEFASAALQRAYYAFWLARPLTPTDRDAFHQALAQRDKLSPRDQALFDALSPSFGDPPDWKESERRVRAYLATRPRDGQAWNALGILLAKESLFREDPDAFAHEAALSTTEVAGHQVWAQVEWTLGHHDVAKHVLADCIARRPESVSCRSQWASFAAMSGECQEMDRLAREMTAIDPASSTGWYNRAYAAAALGASDEAVSELQATAEKHVPAARHDEYALWDAFRMARRRGDLTETLAVIDRIEQTTPAGERDIGTMSEIAAVRAEALWETGDKAGSARVAEAFLKRLPALPVAERAGDDSAPSLFAYTYAGGRMDLPTLRARRSAWIAEQQRRLGDEAWEYQREGIWAVAYSTPAEPTRAEADEAFATLRDLGGDIGEPDSYDLPVATIGALLLGEGRLDDAGRWLRVAMKTCAMVPPVQTMLLAARVDEEKGETARACVGYAAVVAAWPNPKPRSVTVDEARARAKKLGCPSSGSP